MTRVGPAASRDRALPAGQTPGALAGAPGVLSYAINHPRPVPIDSSHTTRTAHSTRRSRPWTMPVTMRLTTSDRGKNVSLRRGLPFEPGALRENGARVIARQRPVEVIALAELARELLQPVHLVRGFDPFGGHVHRQAGGQRDDRADDLGVTALVHSTDERAVDLDRLKRKVVEVAQGGIAHPEVVEAQLDAQGARSEERRVGKECRSRWSRSE